MMRMMLLAGASALALASTSADAAVAVFDFTGSFVTWTAPKTGVYQIDARGAQGGASANPGGLGVAIGGQFDLTAGETLTIAVGERGQTGHLRFYNGYSFDYRNSGAGGGGGSFVADGTSPLIIAGGGGGGARSQSGQNGSLGGATAGGGLGGGAGGVSGGGGGGGATKYTLGGAGGGGFQGDGASVGPLPCGPPCYADGGAGFPHGLLGGATGGYGYGGHGGFGGGGGGGGGSEIDSGGGGGGGGGYSGGGGGASHSNGFSQRQSYGGGGGGSFDAGANPTFLGFRSGDGLVTISAIPEPSTWSLLLTAFGFLGFLLRRRYARLGANSMT